MSDTEADVSIADCKVSMIGEVTCSIWLFVVRVDLAITEGGISVRKELLPTFPTVRFSEDPVDNAEVSSVEASSVVTSEDIFVRLYLRPVGNTDTS